MIKSKLNRLSTVNNGWRGRGRAVHNDCMTRWSVLTVAALCALLPLAWLQQHWMRQLSAAEQERLQAYLGTATARFAQELDEAARPLSFQPVEPPDDERGPFRLDAANPAVIVFRAGPGGEWARVELDLERLRRETLPALFKRHYPAAPGLEFDAVVVDVATPPRQIWASRDGLSEAELGRPDLVVGLLHYRPPAGPPGAEGPPPREEGPPSDGRGPQGELGPPPGGHGPQGQMGPPPRQARGVGPAPWRLLLRHRAGGLEQAVSATRDRNLLLSGAVLLLLALAAATLLVSARNAHQLAQRQMEFVAGVSHELRTPLAVIASTSGNLADGIVASPQQVKQYGSVIQNEGRRLNAMVDQILRFAGIQSGRYQPQLQPCSLEPLLKEAVQTAAPDFERGRLELEQKVPADLPEVLADAASLTHCLRNLLSNAAIHASTGRQVRVSARALEGAVEVAVEDDGPGIAPDDLPHLFEPFYRGGRARSEQIHGFGLGLTLAHRIAAAHNGTLTAENRPGGGARFTLKLPAAQRT